MKLQPKFEIGDLVYSASAYDTEEWIQCPDCLGTKEWSVICPGGDKFTQDCGTCQHGYEVLGKIRKNEIKSHVRALTIGSVRLDTADKQPISYMCEETGIGSGSIYYEENLRNYALPKQ